MNWERQEQFKTVHGGLSCFRCSPFLILYALSPSLCSPFLLLYALSFSFSVLSLSPSLLHNVGMLFLSHIRPPSLSQALSSYPTSIPLSFCLALSLCLPHLSHLLITKLTSLNFLNEGPSPYFLGLLMCVTVV